MTHRTAGRVNRTGMAAMLCTIEAEFNAVESLETVSPARTANLLDAEPTECILNVTSKV
jgi:hypothetical protein